MWRRARTPEQIRDIHRRTALRAEEEHRRALATITQHLDRFGIYDEDVVEIEKDLYLPERPDGLYCQPDIIVWERSQEPTIFEYKRSWKYYPTALLQLGHAYYVMNKITGANPRLFFVWEEQAKPQKFQGTTVSITQVAQLFGTGWEYRSTSKIPRCEHRAELQ